MLEKDGRKVFPATAARNSFLSEVNGRSMSATQAIRTAASPYDVTIQEDMDTYDVRIMLLDNRQTPPEKMVLRIPQGAMSSEGMSPEKLMRGVILCKERLQRKLAKNCDEPEIRLWAARLRDVDLMDNRDIPSRIRIEYNKQNAVSEEKERLIRQENDRAVPKATERSIESDNGPVYDTPPPRPRKIKRRPRITIKGMEVAESAQSKNVYGEPTEPIESEESNSVPVAKVKGAHPKTPIRKPRCKSRDHEDAPEMVFDPDEGVWKCPEPGCKAIARPKSDVPTGQVQMGKGRLDLRVLFVEPGKKPSILLIADNNIALDISEYVEMDNFLKFSRAVQRAQEASNSGEKLVQVDMPAGKFVSAMLKFSGMRIYGCDNA